MKRFTLIVALALMVAMPMMAEHVTPETARKAAITFLNNNGAKTTQMTDLSKSVGFRNLYIFSTESSFVVMSADDCAKPILGYSLTGTFVTERMPENIRGWLQGYSDEIQCAIDNQVSADAETAKEWKDLLNVHPKAAKATTVVDALVQTHWDQNGYYYYSGGQLLIYELYNNLCPYYSNAGERTVTGCVATAMAQIMKYWGYPATGIGYHSYTPESLPSLGEQFADFGATTYDWDNMPNQLNSTSTEAQKMAVATLMYHCGVAVNMDYNISSYGGSSAVSMAIVPALNNYFGYKLAEFKEKGNYSDNEWSNMLKAELDAQRPIQYNGYGTGGHAFICDGYNNSNQFHFNWGWSGQNDGFFSLTSLNPGGSYNFTNDQTAIFGIQPSGCAHDAPTNLSHSIEGTQNVTLTWNAVPGAASYNVYRDFYLVGSTTSTTITDIARFGSNHYWVRCVDANNELSLASEYEIVSIDYQTPIVNDLTASCSDNTVALSWTTPGWCFPETPSNTLTYGNQIPTGTFFPWSGSMYWGHRYLSNTLSAYDGMKVYSVDFYAYNAGTYELRIYEGEPSSSKPSTLVCTQAVTVSATGWYAIDLPNPHTIDKTKDLWVFIHNPQVIDGLKAYLCTASDSNGCYYTSNPLSYAYNYSGFAFLLKTYLTDGTYTYNLYRNGEAVAANLSNNAYTDSNLPDGSYDYHVTTNYVGGESAPSNTVNVMVGNPTYPTTTHTQALNKGWNWYSTYIEQEGIDGLSQLENSIGVPNAIIQSQGDGYVKSVLRNGRVVWGGALGSINNEEMYKIGTKYICEATMEGQVTDPASHPITINKGWNWIGFPCSHSVSVSEALSRFRPKNGDIIKGIHSYATFSNGTWSGTLNTLEPGQGYMYGTKDRRPKTLVYQTGRGNATQANITPEYNYYQPTADYADNMTAIAVVELDGEELRSEDYELAAFAGDECRGSVKMMYVESLNRYIAFLTVFGDQEEELSFVLTDGMNMNQSVDQLTYVVDNIAGSFDNPVVLRFGATGVNENAAANVRIYPNPSEGLFNIEGNTVRRVEVFNALGQPVFSMEAENSFLKLDLTNHASGIYLIRVITDEGIQSHQVMKR